VVVKPTLRDVIVEILGFLPEAGEASSKLGKFAPGEWDLILPWLDDAGLSLYFLGKLKESGAEDRIPKSALAYLEANLGANRCRVAYMERQFVSLNQKLNAAGVKYAAVKGLALVPEFCADASLRHQSDFDYLVEEGSFPAAEHVVESGGYTLRQRKGPEASFVMPAMGEAVGGPGQYEAHAPHAVELHRAIWDGEFVKMFLPEPRFLERVAVREFQGTQFYTLRDEDTYLLQAIHVLGHILTEWVRMSWLYEAAYFLSRRSGDSLLWDRFDVAAGADLRLREAAVIMTELAANLFQAPIPARIRTWGAELRPPVRVWIENYARRWLLGRNQLSDPGRFPTCALPIFLHQQYAADAKARRRVVFRHLLPTWRLSQIAHRVKSKPSSAVKMDFRRRQRIFRRAVFRLAAGAYYLWEVPRWRWLNRASGGFAASRLHKPRLPDCNNV